MTEEQLIMLLNYIDLQSKNRFGDSVDDQVAHSERVYELRKQIIKSCRKK